MSVGVFDDGSGVSKGKLDEDLRPGRRASPCMRLWALRMPTYRESAKS